jgi:hypothetical protein
MSKIRANAKIQLLVGQTGLDRADRTIREALGVRAPAIFDGAPPRAMDRRYESALRMIPSFFIR